MGAPRKHGDAPRGLIWDLHQAGYTSPEITAACERGTASCAPFSIPARTVRQIVTDMSREREFKPRYTLSDLDDLAAIEQTPLAAARIVVREIRRIESKAQPSASDFDKLSKALALQPKIKTALRGGDLRKTPGLNSAAKKDQTAEQPTTVLELIAKAEREQAQVAEGGDTHSATPAPREQLESDPQQPANSHEQAQHDMDAFIEQLKQWEAAKRDDQPP